MRTHEDLVNDKAWQKCEAGHDSHEIMPVETEIGEMWVYDHFKYMGFAGYCSGQDDISRTLAMYGRWEPEETKVARRILENGNRDDLFIDIGSHIGWFSKLARSYGYDVLAFEADAQNIQLYKKNTDDHCTVTRVWFGEDTEDIDLPKNKRVVLLKIDIEGAEQFALVALRHSLDLVDNILMEISPTFNDTYPALVDNLYKYGFTPYFMNGKPFDFNYDFAQDNLLFVRESE